MAIDYGFDKTGRLSTVAGSGSYYSGVTNYASGFAYRAWGAVKEYDYANSTGVNVTYNNRLLPSEIEITGIKANTNASPHTEGGDYTYYADGRLKYATDSRLSIHARAFKYDQHGRAVKAAAGTQAQVLAGLSSSGVHDGAFLHNFNYTAFGDRNYFDGSYWSEAAADNRDYANHRANGWGYDADGRLLTTNDPAPNEEDEWEPLTFSYDAAGRQAGSTQTFTVFPADIEQVYEITKTHTFDGNGQLAKSSTNTRINSGSPGTTETQYYLRSSLTGSTIIELNGSGTKTSAYVYAGGQVIAQQLGSAVLWQHNNPVMGDAVSVQSNSVAMDRTTVDPTGVNTGDENPFVEPWDGEMPGGLSQPMGGDLMAEFFPGAGAVKCWEGGSLISCANAKFLISIGYAERKRSVTAIINNLIRGSNDAPPPSGTTIPETNPDGTPIQEEPGVINIQTYGTYDTWETLHYNLGRSFKTDCVININFHNNAGVSPRLIEAAKAYATRAYGEAGVKVLFNQPDDVPARNTSDVYLVNSWPELALSEMKATNWKPDDVAGWNSRSKPGTSWIMMREYNADDFAKLVTHETGHGYLYPNTVWENNLDVSADPKRPIAGNFHPNEGIMSYNWTSGYDPFTAAEKAFLSKCRFYDYRRR